MSRMPLMVACFVLALAAPARAQENLLVSHHGFILDNADKPVSQPALDLTFRFFDRSAHEDTETQIWTGSCPVRVDNGHYAVVLGDGTCGSNLAATLLPYGTPRYLEIAVAGVTLSPRLKHVGVPNAAHAGDAAKLGGRPAADYLLRSELATTDVLSKVTTGEGLSGEGTAASPLKLSKVIAGDGLSGDGTAASPIRFAPENATIPFAKLAGVPAFLQTVAIGEGLSGNGTAASPLVVSQIGVSVSAPLTGNGTAASALSITFGGNGTALSVSRGDHDHDTRYDVRYLKADGTTPATGSIAIGDDAEDCVSAKNGRLRYRASVAQICVGTTWRTVAAPTPTITSVAPATANAGATITITGTNLGTAGASLAVGGLTTTIATQTATTMTFVITSAHAASPSDVVVSIPGSAPVVAPAAVARTERVAAFDYTGGNQTWVVPSGVTQFEVHLWGAGGTGGGTLATTTSMAGGDGGGGGAVVARFPAATSDVFDILVGQSLAVASGNIGTFAYGGGAAGGGPATQRTGGRGGGRSQITKNAGGVVYAVAGGGGGGNGLYQTGGQEMRMNGGPGGGGTGMPGSGTGIPPGGGTQAAGGAAGSGPTGSGSAPEAGSSGTGGRARGIGVDCNYGCGGGGGGGYFGGGGGEGAPQFTNAQSGGGGSSYVNPAVALSSTHFAGSGRSPGNGGSLQRGNAGIGGDGSNQYFGYGGTNGRVVIVY